MFAGYGAEVLAPEGPHPLASVPPFDSAGNSVQARYFLGGRKAVRSGNLHDAIADAAIIITDSDNPSIHPDTLTEHNPGALVISLTPYGLRGPHSEWVGDDLTITARSGWASVNGLQGQPPLKGSGYQASFQAGTFAFGVAIAAFIDALSTADPTGQVIDIAEFDVLASTFSPAPLRYQYSGFIWPRRSVVDVNEGPVPVKDGYFALTISRPAFWIKAMRVLGLPDLAEDPELAQPGLRGKFKDRFVDRVGNAMLEWTRMDLFYALGEQRVIAGPVLTMDELATNPQFTAREFLAPVDDPGKQYDDVAFPGSFARMSKSRWQRADGAAQRPLCSGFSTPGTIKV
ncbi:MAG: CoA transferase, partial [Proteobacteria bacterium]|nr:CoA transferase [Pseudomonadota bacterium]